MTSDTLPPGFTLVQADAVVPQLWRNGGGQTRELLAWPAGGDWKLRISRADIAADGPFSAFEGIDRWFTVLEGAGVVLHFSGDPTKTVPLRLGHAPLHFDGALAPGCTLLDGATQDLNLMARAGRSAMQAAQADVQWCPSYAVSGLYTATAGVLKTSDANDEPVVLPAHSLLWCTGTPAMHWTFTPDTTDTADAADVRAWWLGYTPDTP